MGFSVGIVFLVFFIKKKTGGEGVQFCYMPNCRTLKNIRSKALTFNDYGKDSVLVQTILKDGDVDFKNSDTKSKKCKTYWVDYEQHSLQIKNCEDTAEVLRLTKE